MLELIGTIATVIAVAGTVLNNRRSAWCFPLWLVSGVMTIGLHVQMEVWSLAVRDLVFLVLAVEGLYRWRQQ